MSSSPASIEVYILVTTSSKTKQVFEFSHWGNERTSLELGISGIL